RRGPRRMRADLVAETVPHPRHEAYIARRVNLPQGHALAEIPNHMHIPNSPASIRGTLRDRYERGKRDAMDATCRKTCGHGADGQVVWSWRPWAGARPVDDDRQVTVTNKVMDTGESTKQPLTPLRRECRCFGFICGDYAWLRVQSNTRHSLRPL